jgi:hypothetical protein
MGGQGERNHPSLMTAVSLLLVSTAMNATVLMPLLAGEVEEPNDLRWDLARNYQLTWESAQLSSSLRNLAQGDELSVQVPHRTLTIALKCRILDTNDVAGLYMCPLVWEALDAGGRPILHHLKLLPFRYEPLGWDVRTGDPRDWPASLILQLCIDPNQTLPSSISSLKGFLCLLYACNKINVDVPFAVGDWIEVLPDLEIRVTELTPPPPGPLELECTSGSDEDPRAWPVCRYTTPLCVYAYSTHVRSKLGQYVIGLGMDWFLNGAYDYALIKTQLVSSDGKGVADVAFLRPVFYGERGILASGGWEQDLNSWNVIRHRIAVKPYEVKVPFELKNIPIPTCQPIEMQAGSDAGTSAPL